MIPSLKSMYELNLQKRIDEIKANPELLKEAVDQRMIDEMERSLGKLSKILSAPELASLDSFHLGLQKAHEELTNVLAAGPITTWVHERLPKGLTAIGRLAAFTTGITKLMKQLPQIVNIVKGRMGAERQVEWDENAPLHQALDSDSTNKLLSILEKAMAPSSGFLSFSQGLPYVKESDVANEILGLSFNQLRAFSGASKAVEPPAVTSQAKELAQDVKAASAAGSEKPAGAPAGPVPVQKQLPTVAEMETILQHVYDETLSSWKGEEGLGRKTHELFEKFKLLYVRKSLETMLQLNVIKKGSRPKRQA